jgi:signal peptidase II
VKLPIPPPRTGRIKIYPGVVATALVVLAVDQLTKSWVTDYLGRPDGPRSVEIVGDYVRLTYTTNTGAAFGMFPAGTLFFTIVALIAVPILLVARSYVGERAWWMTIVFGLMLGGALGNLLDRLRVGRVTDFIDVGVGSVRWWAFNVADASFVVGVILLALYLSLGPEQTADARDDRSVVV